MEGSGKYKIGMTESFLEENYPVLCLREVDDKGTKAVGVIGRVIITDNTSLIYTDKGKEISTKVIAHGDNATQRLSDLVMPEQRDAFIVNSGLAERGSFRYKFVWRELEEGQRKEREYRELRPWKEGSLNVRIKDIKDIKVLGIERDAYGNLGYAVGRKDEEEGEFVEKTVFDSFPEAVKEALEKNPIGIPLEIVTYAFIPSSPENVYGYDWNYVSVWPEAIHWNKVLLDRWNNETETRKGQGTIPALLLSPQEIEDLFGLPPNTTLNLMNNNKVPCWHVCYGASQGPKFSIEEMLTYSLGEGKVVRTGLRGRNAEDEEVRAYAWEEIDTFKELAEKSYTQYFSRHGRSVSGDVLDNILNSFAMAYAIFWRDKAIGVEEGAKSVHEAKEKEDISPRQALEQINSIVKEYEKSRDAFVFGLDLLNCKATLRELHKTLRDDPNFKKALSMYNKQVRVAKKAQDRLPKDELRVDAGLEALVFD